MYVRSDMFLINLLYNTLTIDIGGIISIYFGKSINDSL